MFKYWQGYEIDGSDTSFDLLLPDQATAKELLAFFLALPLWDKDAGMSIDTDDDNRYLPSHRDLDELSSPFDPHKAAQAMAQNKGDFTYLTLRCLHPDLLPEQLSKEIFALTATRPRLTDLPQPVRPSSGLYGFTFESYLNVGLLIYAPGKGDNPPPCPPNGLLFNKEAFAQNQSKESKIQAELHCGPSFFYEYIAYLTQKISERFPEIGICGGLDCAGGFIEGCTYASDLYAYEVFTFTGDPAASLARLIDSGLIAPVMLTKEKGYRQVFRKNDKTFYLLNHEAVKAILGYKDVNIPLAKYLDFAERVFA